MPWDRPTAGSVAEWLARARGDLALATAAPPPGAFYEDLCFHAQQAAEKALKAVYVHRGWSFRYTHDLARLLRGLESQGLVIPEAIRDATDLSTYAFVSRYPGLGEPATESDRDEAVRQAVAVLEWAEETIAALD